MKGSSTTSRRIAYGAVAVVVAAVMVRGFWIEPRRVEAVPVSISCGRGGAPWRLLLFSDVGFQGEGRRERDVRKAAERFDPDLVLIAGDFFDHARVLREAPKVRLGAAFIEALPARGGRFLVLGELEGVESRVVRQGVEPRTTVLVNESRRIDSDGRCLELFGSYEPADGVPWVAGRDRARARAFVSSRHAPRRREQRLRCVANGSEAWSPREVTVTFQAATPRARVAIVMGGVRVVRHEGRSDFGVDARLVGRTRSGFAPRPGVWYRARIEARPGDDGTRVRARFWPEGAPEPGTWMIHAVDLSDREGPRGTIELGGLWGEARYTDLEARDGRGARLISEDFADEAGWRSRWDSDSILEAWLERTAGSPCARVVLAHNPDVVRAVRDLRSLRPCAVLAGHTHGGQVRLPGIGALYSSTWIGRRFDRGLFDFDGVPLYITAGVSTSIVPIRLFDPPEVTLLTLDP